MKNTVLLSKSLLSCPYYKSTDLSDQINPRGTNSLLSFILMFCNIIVWLINSVHLAPVSLDFTLYAKYILIPF